jgi:DNA-directed RNA polymerase subunit N (RpoN/RPB10)
MSQQEANAFSERVVEEVAEKVNDDPSLTVGPAQNAVLDDLGVPRYPECVDGEE